MDAKVQLPAVAPAQSFPTSAVHAPGRTGTVDRDLRLDLLRGFCLFAMTIDHVEGRESWIYAISPAHAIQLVTAAECFVFVSGVVAGLVYGSVAASHGLWRATARIFSRIGKLYAVIVGLALFYLVLGFLFPSLFSEYRSDPVDAIVAALTLRVDRTDLFAMYIVFLALAPVVFYAVQAGKTWPVLAVSALVWLGSLTYPNNFELPIPVSFQFGSWQVIFVLGLVLGYHRTGLADVVGRHRTLFLSYQALISLLAIALLAVKRLVESGVLNASLPAMAALTAGAEGGFAAALSDNARLAPIRMFTALVYVQAFLLVVHYLFRPLRAGLGWFLIPLGQASLYVYTMHLVLLYVLLQFVPGFDELPEPFYGFGLIGIVVLLWAMVKTRFLFFLIPR
jgi:hypothetical protein